MPKSYLKRIKLRTPLAFFWKDRNQWAVDFQELSDATGRIEDKRKTFRNDLLKNGKLGTLEEQKESASKFASELRKKQQEREKLRKQETGSALLSFEQLVDAKKAFDVLNDVPLGKRSLLDAVIQYRGKLKLAIDTPLLEYQIMAFLAMKYKGVVDGFYSETSYKNIRQNLNIFFVH